MSATTLETESSRTRIIKMLNDARDQLETAEGEFFLDLCSVTRLDPADVDALSRLSVRADERSVKVSLQNVNVDVYKVLKLVKLADRFTFAN